jgi:uncharacterized protein involved in response to NO
MATSAQQMRTFAGHPVLSAGFRPFFLASSVWAALMVPVWIWIYSGHGAGIPVAWHAHEMVFGYLGGVIGGFLLTAIPNWTGRLPVTGAPLLGLFSLWTFGRLAMILPMWQGPGVMIADSAFLVVFAAVVWREVLAGKNWRNLPVAIMVTVLALCNLAFHAGETQVSIRLALSTILTLTSLVGGRIIPSFTTNWLKKKGLALMPAPFNAFDLVVIIATAIGLVAWASGIFGAVAGIMLYMAGALNFLRLARWRGQATLSEPLVWILHLGYAWLALGLLLLGMATLNEAIGINPAVPAQGGIHALTAGAIGVMTLAVMTRASLGHTGRALAADRATTAIYMLVNLAAVARVLAALAPEIHMPGLILSSLFWIAAFGGFAAVYGPKLLSPRVRTVS